MPRIFHQYLFACRGKFELLCNSHLLIIITISMSSPIQNTKYQIHSQTQDGYTYSIALVQNSEISITPLPIWLKKLLKLMDL